MPQTVLYKIASLNFNLLLHGQIPGCLYCAGQLLWTFFTHDHREARSCRTRRLGLPPRYTMSPSTSHTAGQLRQLIYYHLDNNLVRNALFLAGRLHAYEPRSSEAAYLLALCHLHSGQAKAAWDYSRHAGSRGTHVGCSYVYAQACLDLGKYVDGVTALERSKGTWASKNHWSKHRLFDSFEQRRVFGLSGVVDSCRTGSDCFGFR